MSQRAAQPKLFFPSLADFLDSARQEFELIGPSRQAELRQLAAYVHSKNQLGQTARLNYICTHNSRRSHLGQIWGQVAAWYYGLPHVSTFSGGTEATAFNPRAVTALRAVGFQIAVPDLATTNPRYQVLSGPELPDMVCFSKKFDDSPNPTTGYCAVMTCTQADEACPLVPGCELRLPIRYEDPKVADDTPEEADRYRERSRQICREMLYAMSQVA
jgi:arsenate reductase